jgi:TonB family protein
MKPFSPHLSLIVFACILLLEAANANAQRDTVEFKLIPNYYPEQGAATDLDTSAIVYQPTIEFPNDPKLKGRDAKVIVNVLVDLQGNVSEAEVIKSTNKSFNQYALKYARQYRFRLPKDISKGKETWVTLPIEFKEH